jgi:two-component system nitrate/nitrite response regulator NarL
MSIRLALMTPLRLLAESLYPCLKQQPDIEHVALAFDHPGLVQLLTLQPFHLVLIDVSHGLDAERVRATALRFPEVKLVALGPEQSRDHVLSCARCGFVGYIPRDATLEQLCISVRDAAQGRLNCTGEIASFLMQALFASDSAPLDGGSASVLTARESEVARLVERGFSNKDIARQLRLSVATVKSHVHNVLTKLSVGRRVELVRGARSRLPSA